MRESESKHETKAEKSVSQLNVRLTVKQVRFILGIQDFFFKFKIK